MTRAIAMIFLLSACPRPAANRDAVARDAATELFAGRYASVTARMASATKQVLTETKLAAVMDPIRSANPGATADITVTTTTDTSVELLAHLPAGDHRLTVSLDRRGLIIGLRIKEATANHDAYESQVPLRLPFHGAWTAMNASRDDHNPHFSLPAQRWAVDWVKTDARGKTFKGDGANNSDYYAYNQEALAPADATVIAVVDGIAENPARTPGDSYYIPGNSLVLAIAENEYALFCHLIPGSMRVHVGEKVHAGEVLARVGNSGNSSEPHLHFQLMNKPRPTDAEALPAKFSEVSLNGKPTPLAWPDERDVLSEAP